MIPQVFAACSPFWVGDGPARHGYRTGSLLYRPAPVQVWSMPVRLPRSALRRNARTYALLILRPSRSRALRLFEGKVFKSGIWIPDDALWPTPHFPRVPLLMEYAGTSGLAASGKPARGHNRARDVRVLWRYAGSEWQEIARCETEGSEWYEYMLPIVRIELARPESRPGVDHVGEARSAAGRLAALIDGELAQLAGEGREAALGFLYDEVALRCAEAVEDLAAGYGPLFAAPVRRRRRAA
jgi:hypothetical protein